MIHATEMLTTESSTFQTVKRIPDKLWDEIRLILPSEKPANTIGRPAISFRKVLDGILYVLRTGCQ